MKFNEINGSMIDDILIDLDKQRIRLVDVCVPVTVEQRIETGKRIDEWDLASEKWADGSMLCYEDNIVWNSDYLWLDEDICLDHTDEDGLGGK